MPPDLTNARRVIRDYDDLLACGWRYCQRDGHEGYAPPRHLAALIWTYDLPMQIGLPRRTALEVQRVVEVYDDARGGVGGEIPDVLAWAMQGVLYEAALAKPEVARIPIRLTNDDKVRRVCAIVERYDLPARWARYAMLGVTDVVDSPPAVVVAR